MGRHPFQRTTTDARRAHPRPGARRRRPRAALGRLALVATLLASAPTASAVAAAGAGPPDKLGPRLQAAAAQAAPDARLPVIVMLRDPVRPMPATMEAPARIGELRRRAAQEQPALGALTGAPDRWLWLVNAFATRATPDELSDLERARDVAFIDVDAAIRVTDTGPAQTAATSTWGIIRIRAEEAWARYGTRGAGAVIASLDTGVDASHPALAGRIAGWRDFVASRSTPYDDNGHGTHTIGTMVSIGAAGSPIGVAPDARVLVAKTISGDGTGTASAALAAAQWIADPDGNPATDDAPDVVNNSWGAGAGGDAWFREMVRQWRALGIVPVFAAGNTGPGAGTVVSPADFPESIAVAAVGESGHVASFSARGPVIWADPDGTGPPAGTRLAKPDVAAPGVGVDSTVPGGGHAMYSGTSMAAPHVAATVALLARARPGLTAAAAAAALRAGAVDAGPAGPDDDFGAGVIDVLRTLEAAGSAAAVPAPPPSGTAPATPENPLARPPRRATLVDLQRGRTLAVAAARKLRALERLAYGRRRPAAVPAPPTVRRVSLAELGRTRRIAKAVLTRTSRLRVALGMPRARRWRPPAAPPLRLTRADARSVQRLARRALLAVRSVPRSRIASAAWRARSRPAR